MDNVAEKKAKYNYLKQKGSGSSRSKNIILGQWGKCPNGNAKEASESISHLYVVHCSFHTYFDVALMHLVTFKTANTAS